MTFILFHSASRLYVHSSFLAQATINSSFQHSSQMKTLSVGKGYVTVYFFAIMIHCSLTFVTKAVSCNPMLMRTQYDSPLNQYSLSLGEGGKGSQIKCTRSRLINLL